MILNEKEKIVIFINKEIDDFLIKKIEENLEEFIKSNQLIITPDFKKIEKAGKALFLTSLGMTSKNTLVNIKDRIIFSENKVMGLIVLNNL